MPDFLDWHEAYCQLIKDRAKCWRTFFFQISPVLLMKIDASVCAVTGLQRDADLADLLYIQARSKSVRLCMRSCRVCLPPSLTQLDTDLDNFPNFLCGFCIKVKNRHASDLLTMTPVDALSSALRTQRSWDLDSFSPGPFPPLLWDTWLLLGFLFLHSLYLAISSPDTSL